MADNMTDPTAIADAIDPRNWPRVGYPTPGMPEHYTIYRADLIAAADMLRTLSPIKDEEIAGMVRRLRERALAEFNLGGDPIAVQQSVPEVKRDYHWQAADLISRLHTCALLARGMALSEAAKVAEADRADECVYATDKPGDPTWTHTDDDTCPKCGGCPANGTDIDKCVGTARNRIAAAIRSLSSTTDIEAMVEREASTAANSTGRKPAPS